MFAGVTKKIFSSESQQWQNFILPTRS